MVRIESATTISAPIERCFDLARSIDLHVASTSGTSEQAVDGRTSGLIGFGETVTWRGKHFGLWLRHSSRITKFDRPRYFQDCMDRGCFKLYQHDHFFRVSERGTQMTDIMEFEAPFRFLGRLAETLVLEPHLKKLLETRNNYIKKVAESEEWKKLLPS